MRSAHHQRAETDAPRPAGPRRPLVRRRSPPADAPLPQRLESDLSPDRPVAAGELDAIERLLGEDLRAFLAATH
jgi:hypothetical protein